MLVKEVIETLRRLTTESLSSEDRTRLETLASMLDPHGTMAVVDLEAKLTSGPPSAKTKKGSAAKPKKITPVDHELAGRYSAALEDAVGDPTRLKSVLADLKANKQVRVGELAAILSRARGRQVAVAKKGEGLKEVEQWFQRRQDTARRLRGADGIY